MQLTKSAGLFICLTVVIVAVTMTIFYSTPNDSMPDHSASGIVDKSEVTIDRRNGDRVYQGRPFTGEAVSYYSSGQMSVAEQFVNGRRHGYLKQWFENGILSFESIYKNGRREGSSISWWSNGIMRSKAMYVNDNPDGESLSWYFSGEKFKKKNFVDGQYVGLQQGWRRNGKLFSNFEYKNGRVFGLNNSNLCIELNDEAISLNQEERANERQIPF